MAHVTIGDLKRERRLLEVGCQGCSRHAYVDPGSLGVSDGQSVPLLAKRLRCARCGTRNDAIHSPGQRTRVNGLFLLRDG